jgi:hypothetical protein
MVFAPHCQCTQVFPPLAGTMQMKYAVLLSVTLLFFGSSEVMAQETPEPSINTATQAGTGQPRRARRRIWGAGSQPTNSNGQMATDNEGKLKPFGTSPTEPPTETSGSAPTSPE